MKIVREMPGMKLVITLTDEEMATAASEHRQKVFDRNGVKAGRRPITIDSLPRVFVDNVDKCIGGKMTVTMLSRLCGISRPTAYRYMRIYMEG